MKITNGLIFALALSTSVLGQTPGVPASKPADPASTLVQPPGLTSDPAPTTNTAKAKKPVKKKTTAAAPKTKATAPAPIISTPLVTNAPATVKEASVLVRAQATINSESITHLKRGDTVQVLEEITLKKTKANEPNRWARIALPAGTHLWINASFVDTNMVVTPAKLHIRSGPGENFTVMGVLHKGDSIKPLGAKGAWAEIEPPPGTSAFVAAHLLTQVATAPVVAETPVPKVVLQPEPTKSIVDAQPNVAPPPTTTPGGTEPTPAPPVTPPVVVPPAPVIPEPQPAPVVDETPRPRIVQREGVVGGMVNIQAPTHYELKSLDNGSVIEYLYTPTTNLVLKRWVGKTVFLTGEEGLDERWPNIPVLTIKTIQVVQ